MLPLLLAVIFLHPQQGIIQRILVRRAGRRLLGPTTLPPAGSLCLSVSLFVLQVGLCFGIACGSWIFVTLRGPAAPSSPLNLGPPQRELAARACSQVEQCASSATTPDEAVPVAPGGGADVAFAARRHISSSAGQPPADTGSGVGSEAVAGPLLVSADAGAAGSIVRMGAAGSWVVGADAGAEGSVVRTGVAWLWGQAGLQRHAWVPGRGDGAGSRGRSGLQGRRRGGRGRSAGVAGAEGLASGLARMDRVTFSTLKPTFCVVSESE